MKIWITTVGTSPFAVFNSLWMAIVRDSYYPDKVYLLWNERVSKNKETIREYIERLAEVYGQTIVIDDTISVDEDDFKNFTNVLKKIIKKEKLEGNEVVIDMTPGRKFMSAFSMYAGINGVEGGKYRADKVYYLHLRDLSYMNVPLYLIPFSLQELYEMKQELIKDEKREPKPLKFEDGRKWTKITREELLAVINQEFLEAGMNRISISVKSHGQVMAVITLSNANRARISVKSFKLPRYADEGDLFSSVLNASGVREMRATLDGEEWMSEETLYRWLLKEIKKKETQYITFDTNSMIFMVPQRFLEFLDKQRDKAYSLNLAISRIVESELTVERAKISRDGRYKGEIVPDRDYWNQPSPKDRLFKLGIMQLKLLNERNTILIESKGKELGDNAIKESFVEFLRMNDGELIVITSDKNFFANLRHIRDIVPIYIEFGDVKDSVSWENVRDFLFATAVVFGKINVSGVGGIKGVWWGKNPWEWDKIMVNLKPEARKAIKVLRAVLT